MKITCNRQKLLEAFQIASNVVPTKSTLPTLTNVKLSVETSGKEKFLELVGTDLEVGVRYFIPAVSVKEDGVVIIPANRIAGILRDTVDEEVTIESDGKLANIKCSDSNYKALGVDPTDFPEIPQFEKTKAFSIGKEEILEMVKKTAFATSPDVIRYALTGVLFEIKNKELRMVASDGKRLAYIKRKISGKVAEESPKELKVLIPPKALALLERVLTEEDETVAVNVNDSEIKFKTKNALIFSRLVEGSFPDYEIVIPSDLDKKVVIKSEPFISAVRRASLFTTEKAKAVKLSFAKDKLTVFTRTADVGEAKIDVATEYKGEPFEITFNPDYFVDYLKVTEEESFEGQFKDKKGAAVFKSGKDYTYVVMPLTVEM